MEKDQTTEDMQGRPERNLRRQPRRTNKTAEEPGTKRRVWWAEHAENRTWPFQGSFLTVQVAWRTRRTDESKAGTLQGLHPLRPPWTEKPSSVPELWFHETPRILIRHLSFLPKFYWFLQTATKILFISSAMKGRERHGPLGIRKARGTGLGGSSR